MVKRRAITITLTLTVPTVAALSLHSTHLRAREIPQVSLLRTPHGGIQPQTVLDRDGALHMIYFKGDASAGEIQYVRRPAPRKHFSSPSSWTPQPGSAG